MNQPASWNAIHGHGVRATVAHLMARSTNRPPDHVPPKQNMGSIVALLRETINGYINKP